MKKAIDQGSKHGGIARPLADPMNEQTPAVIKLLADGDVPVCLAAHQVLETLAGARRHLHGPEQRPQLFDGVLKAVPSLTNSLAPAKEVRVRLAALYVLETLDEGAADAVDTVDEVLRDKTNGYVRWGAARVLKNMAPQASDKAVPALTQALSAEDNKTVRLTIVTALERYGPKAAPAVEALGKASADAEPRIRTEAIHALSAIGEKARSQEGLLVKTLKADQTPAVRVAAAEALGRWQPLSAEAAKALRDALGDADAAVRRAASDALLSSPGKPAEDLPPP
jgi:HEAT repeat protein